jgi:hypothetical protein
VQILHTADPAADFARLLIRLIDRVDINWGSARNILALNVFQFQYGLVFVIQTWFVKDSDTQVFLLSIWLWHLQESINFTNSWDVVRNEWLDLGFQINFLGLVSLNVLKHFFELR